MPLFPLSLGKNKCIVYIVRGINSKKRRRKWLAYSLQHYNTLFNYIEFNMGYRSVISSFKQMQENKPGLSFKAVTLRGHVFISYVPLLIKIFFQSPLKMDFIAILQNIKDNHY